MQDKSSTIYELGHHLPQPSPSSEAKQDHTNQDSLPQETNPEAVTIEDLSPEIISEAATVVVEDPETHQKLEIAPTKPPKSYGKANSLMTKAAVEISTNTAQCFFSQLPLLASSAGQSLLSGSLATMAGAVDIARSNNKKRSVARVLPTVGLSLIPGVGLPLAIGLGMASSFTADKIYTRAEIRDRNLKLDKFWPSQYDFPTTKEVFLDSWVNTYDKVVDEHFDRDSKYYDKAREVIEVIQWLSRSLTKLRNHLLIDWHWKKISLAAFAKNMKEITKGVKVCEIELQEICKVIQQGAEDFVKTVESRPEDGSENSEGLDQRMKTVKENAKHLETVRAAIKEGITEAMKYLTDEKKRLK